MATKEELQKKYGWKPGQEVRDPKTGALMIDKAGGIRGGSIRQELLGNAPAPGTPTATENTTLGDIRGQSAQASGVYDQLLKGGFAGLSDPNAPASQYQSAIYNQLTQGFDSQKKQEGAQLEQTLANRGIPVGSEAWQNAMQTYDQNWSQKYGQAQNQAVTENVNATNQGLQTLGGFNQNIFNTLTGKQIGAANNSAQIAIGKGNNAAQLGVAGIGAQTSANNLAAQLAQNNQSGGAFNGTPPQ